MVAQFLKLMVHLYGKSLKLQFYDVFSSRVCGYEGRNDEKICYCKNHPSEHLFLKTLQHEYKRILRPNQDQRLLHSKSQNEILRN